MYYNFSENELKITPICTENIDDKTMKNHDIITSNIYDIPAYEMESLVIYYIHYNMKIYNIY